MAAPTSGSRFAALLPPAGGELHGLLRALPPLLGARRVSLVLVEESTRAWLVAAEGPAVGPCHPVAVVPGIAAEALRTACPVLIPDLTLSPFPAHPERGYATRSCMAAPVFWENTVCGVICAADPDHNPAFTAEDLAKLQLLADHLGACLRLVASALAVADTDSVTGAQTRRAFEQRVAVEVERCHRFGGPISLLLLDVDLNRLREAEGHPAGDRALHLVARTLLKTVRRIDLVARYDGDDFAVLLPATGSQESLKAAHRVMLNLHQLSLPGEGHPHLPIRVSVGAATLPPARTAEELLEQASRSMVLARGDRERLRHWNLSAEPARPGVRPCTCARCGRAFSVGTESRRETRRYCSKGCAAAARREAKQERNAAILSLRESGLTLQAIAERYGVSVERVRQICASR